MVQSITNNAAQNVPYALAAVSTMEGDRQTINDAAGELIVALRDSGFGVTAGTPLVMLCPLPMKSRVEAALNPVQTQFVSGVGMSYNITPYYTAYLDWASEGAVTGGTDWVGDGATEAVPLGYMCVPGRKNKIGNRMNLTLLAETDILAFAETVAGWGRYGAYLHEIQWRRVSSIQ